MRPAKTATDLRYGRRGGNWQVDQRQTVAKCEAHPHWWRLNALIGCIHPECCPDYPPLTGEARP